MAICPFCKAEMPDPPVTHKMTKKQREVYEYILSAGMEGMSREKVIDAFFKGRSVNTIRSCIFNINNIIRPSRVIGRHKKYYVSID
jgi:hypothetical protein